MESVMILQFVESLQFLKVLVSLVRTQFKPISTQFKALKFFLEGSAPEDPRWGGVRAPPNPSAPFGCANAHCRYAHFLNWGLTAPVVIFWLTLCPIPEEEKKLT